MRLGYEMRLYIGGVDYGAHVDHDSLESVSNVEKNQDDLHFTVTLNRIGAALEMPCPKALQEVVWAVWDTTLNAEVSREFGGVVGTVNEQQYGGNAFNYAVSCTSYVKWFNRHLVTERFQQQFVDDTIKTIVSKYCPGFDASGVKARITLPPQNFIYRKPSDAIQAMLDQCGYSWYIDATRKLHVFKFENLPAPLPNNTLNLDTDLVNYSDLVLVEDGEAVYNKYTLRGFRMRSKTTFPFTFKGDGTATSFTLGTLISTRTSDTIVTVDGVSYNVQRDPLEGTPGSGNSAGVAYIHFGTHTLRFASAPASGAQIVATCYYLQEKTRSDSHPDSVDFVKNRENSPASDGVYEFAEKTSSLSQQTEDAINAKMEVLALKYGLPVVRGSFTSFTQGWQAGQSFRMTSAIRLGGISVDERFYVTKVSKKWMQPAHPTATYDWNRYPIRYGIDITDRPFFI